MNKSAKFWNRMATRYSKSPVPNEEIYQQKLLATQDYMHKDMDVLEFACGTGSTAVIHSPFVKSYMAIDFSDKMIEIAKSKKQEELHKNLKFLVADFNEFEASESSFDMILGLSILHLMDEPEKALNKAFKLLKTDGYFVSSSACIKDRMPWFKYIAGLGHKLGLIPKVNVFSQQELETMLIEAGFSFEYKLTPSEGSSACFYICKKVS